MNIAKGIIFAEPKIISHFGCNFIIFDYYMYSLGGIEH